MTDGCSVEEAEGLGRVLVARHSFSPWGAAVLAEAPLLRWRALAGREGLAELLEARRPSCSRLNQS